MQEIEYPITEDEIIVKAQHPGIVWRAYPWQFVGMAHNTFHQYWTEADYNRALADETISDDDETREIDLYPWGYAAWYKE